MTFVYELTTTPHAGFYAKCDQVTSSIFPLYQSHYRVRTYIAACLEERVSKSALLAHTSQRAAFELAFCYTLGFGVDKNDTTASALLKQAARSQEELTSEIDRVRYGRLRLLPRKSVYAQSTYRGHTILRSTAGGRQYLDEGTLDEAASHIRKEMTDVEIIMGADHKIVRSLKSTLSGVLILQKRWEEAQELETQIWQRISRTLGERHPDTISTMSSLALIHHKQKRWKEAESLQTQAMTASLSGLGTDHGVTLNCMSNLAILFSDQGKWEKAERLGKQVLQIRENALGLEHPDTLNSAEILTDFKKDQDFWKREEMKAVQVTIKRSRSS